MQFSKRLRKPIKSGQITSSVRIWKSPRVRVGGRYRLDEGWIEVDGLHEISLSDVTPTLAKETGFTGVVDLLRTAKHGHGERVFLVKFRYVDREDPMST